MGAADEAQARDYREQARRRQRFERARLRALRGDRAAAEAVRRNWQPILDAIREEERHGRQEAES